MFWQDLPRDFKDVFLQIEGISYFRRGHQVTIWEQEHASLPTHLDPRVPAMMVVARCQRRHSHRRLLVCPPTTHPSFTPPKSGAAGSHDVATHFGFNRWSHKQAKHVSRNANRAPWSRHFASPVTSSKRTT